MPDDPLLLDGPPGAPLVLLSRWWRAAGERGAVAPECPTLATASRSGVPPSRTVRQLEVEADALLFCTNTGSRKGTEMAETGRAAASVHRPGVDRSVSVHRPGVDRSVDVSGEARFAADDENDRRFAEDPRPVQAARTVSVQGRPLADEAAQLAAFRAPVDAGESVPRPPSWSWSRLLPDAVTVWQPSAGSLNRRIHDRRDAGRWTHDRIEG